MNIIICFICCMNIWCILIMWSSRAALLSSFSASAFVLFSSNSLIFLSDSCICLSNCSNTSNILLSASVLFLRIPEFEGVLLEAVNVAVAEVVVAGDISLSLAVSSSCASPPSLLSSSFCPCGELPCLLPVILLNLIVLYSLMPPIFLVCMLWVLNRWVRVCGCVVVLVQEILTGCWWVWKLV